MRFTVYNSVLTICFDDPQKVRHFRDDAAHRWSILTRDRLIELSDPEASNDLFLLFSVADRAAIILDRDVSARVF